MIGDREPCQPLSHTVTDVVVPAERHQQGHLEQGTAPSLESLRMSSRGISAPTQTTITHRSADKQGDAIGAWGAPPASLAESFHAPLVSFQGVLVPNIFSSPLPSHYTHTHAGNNPPRNDKVIVTNYIINLFFGTNKKKKKKDFVTKEDKKKKRNNLRLCLIKTTIHRKNKES